LSVVGGVGGGHEDIFLKSALYFSLSTWLSRNKDARNKEPCLMDVVIKYISKAEPLGNSYWLQKFKME
jgi:hypothetical protein